jgi:hypothetical protein
MLNFIKTALNFTHFVATLKLGMKHELDGQNRAQRQGDFTDNFHYVYSLCLAQRV